MISSSHKALANLLICKYLTDKTELQKKCFYLGCIQPDKNPITYLKGSIRHSALRGHNWYNARNYILRTLSSLQVCKMARVFDYYKFGKLIHYLADVFTFPHNNEFGDDLTHHRIYEKELHYELVRQITAGKITTPDIIDLQKHIDNVHSKYVLPPFTAEKDASYILTICSTVAKQLSNPLNAEQLHNFCI